MSQVKEAKNFIFHTQLGNVIVQRELVEGYDVEDIVSDRAFSQAMAIRFYNLSREIDINKPQAARTIPSAYLEADDDELEG